MRRLVVLTVAVMLAGCRRDPTAAERLAAAEREGTSGSVSAQRTSAARYRALLPAFHDAATRARIHFRLGELYLTTDPPRADGEFEQAVSLATQAGDVDQALAARVQRLYEGPESTDAKVAALRALSGEAHAAGARRAERDATILLGIMLVTVRNMSEAVTVLGGAAALIAAAPDRASEVQAERWLGVAYYTLGDADHALPHYMRALDLARAYGLALEEAHCTQSVGSFHLWLRRDAQLALVYFTRALVGFEALGMSHLQSGIGARAGLATAQSRLGDHAAALATLTVALADARANGADSEIAATLISVGDAYVQVGRADDARQGYAEAARLARKLDDMHMHTLALLGATGIDLDQHRWREAEQTIGEALTFIAAKEALVKDEKLRLPFTAATRNLTKVLLEALVGQGDLARAFAASERMRSRRLLAALGSDAILDGEGARGLVDGDTTLVEYTYGRTRAYAFVVDAGAVHLIDLGPAKDVQVAARRWYELASALAPPPGALEAATRTLADLILTPVAPRLRGKRLVIVPDAALHYVAFAPLPLPDGHLLIERFELVHAPSASVLRALRGRRDDRARPTLSLALLADPIFDRSDARVRGAAAPPPATIATRDADLARLLSTHAEAEAIAALLPAREVFRVEGEEATRAAALGPEVAGARFIHFATHAILDNVDPDRSGLVLTQVDASGAPIDGFVRVDDIERARLSAELVVLSACRTAIGKSFDGEGLVGLTRAFLRAGVPEVVSSLWQVDDVATADLMARFYRGLLGDRLAAPAALRRAQLEAVARKAPLRQWAAFAFYGDWR